MPPDTADELDTYAQRWLLSAPVQAHWSPLTIKNYQQDLKTFLRYAQLQKWQHPLDLTTPRIKQFLGDLNRQGLSAKTIQRMYASLKGFLKYVSTQTDLPPETGQGIKTPKAPRKLPALLEVEDLELLLNQPSDDFVTARDLAILELFYSSGLRLSELQQLNDRDLNADDSTVRVMGKGQKERLVPVGAKAWQALQHYFTFRSQIPRVPDPSALFVNTNGKRMSARSIQLRVRHWGLKLGKKLHPHLLRHCFASHVLSSSQNLRAVQDMLGHASLSSTEIYTHLDFMQLAAVYDACHPRAKEKPDPTT